MTLRPNPALLTPCPNPALLTPCPNPALVSAQKFNFGVVDVDDIPNNFRSPEETR